jgi:AmmeMemoRadiSam system protein B
MDAREPAVAGRFYPAPALELATLVDRLLDAAGVPEAGGSEGPGGGEFIDEPLAAAYVVPHAGYRYSGPTAARVYARLRQHAAEVRRVVLIGPAHYVRLTGCAAPSKAAWLTPLGEVPVDRVAVGELAEGGHAIVDDLPHEREHALEVQLPFLQRVLPAGVPIIPLAVGASRPDDVLVTLLAAVRPGTLVLCSTDLSHYLMLEDAQRQDERTAQAVLDLAPESIGVRDACGVYALRGLLAWARHHRLRPGLLHLCTSADATGDPSRVVGYAAFAFRSG